MKKNQSGFSGVEAIVILIIIGVIGSIGWFIWQRGQNSQDSKTNSALTHESKEKVAAQESKKDLVYTNVEAGLTFSYPSTWKNEAKDMFRYEDGMFGGVGGTLTLPSGKTASWIYQVAGGKGGDCVPAEGDVAFRAGNECASKQIIGVEKIPSVSKPANTNFRNLFGDNLYITRTKYLAAGSDGKVTYQTCLDAYAVDEKPEIGTRMGLLFPCLYWDTGFNVKYEVNSEADFKSSDVKQVENVMKTFKSAQ